MVRAMKIATWNVNGLRARLDFVLHWLEARRPDLVGLQELKLEDEQFPHDELEAAGYRALTHGQKAWNGVAVLSRSPAELIERGLPGEEEQGARLITAEVEGIRFTTLYCPNGKSVSHDDFPLKLAWYDTLVEHLSAAPDGPRVVCGDFNICPSPLDTWNEKGFAGRIFHTDEERSRFRAILDLGLHDVYREAHPDGRMFSWWDYRGGAFHRNMGLRIDFLLASPGVMERVEQVEIDREYRKKKDGMTASDHAPVMMGLRA